MAKLMANNGSTELVWVRSWPFKAKADEEWSLFNGQHGACR